MYSFHMQTTQLLLHCRQATDEEYRVAADSLLPLCLWLGAELMYEFLEEMNDTTGEGTPGRERSHVDSFEF